MPPNPFFFGSINYGTIRFPNHTYGTHEDVMEKVKKACQHIHGRAFVVNKTNDNLYRTARNVFLFLLRHIFLDFLSG
jgi:hypothetical protein